MHRALRALVLLLAACETSPRVSGPPTSLPVSRTVTIAALDPVTNEDNSPVQIWDDPEQRTRVVGSVKTGDSVGFVEQRAQAILIRLPDGTRGWVSAVFIQELREKITTPE